MMLGSERVICVCGQIKNFRKSGYVTNVSNSAILTVAGQRQEELLFLQINVMGGVRISVKKDYYVFPQKTVGKCWYYLKDTLLTF